jgi:acyl-CoA thioester hydrolase
MEIAGPADRRPPFKFCARTRVGFSDTDAQGIVYYGRYLPFFDLARVEYLRHLRLLRGHRETLQFVMRASSVEYFAPAVFDDLIEIYVRIARIGSTSETWEFAAARTEDDVLLATAQQTPVLVELETRRPTPIPEWYRAPIRDFEGTDVEVAART